jgi:hypothetical protein
LKNHPCSSSGSIKDHIFAHIAKAILSKESNAGDITILNFKQYYSVIAM